MHVEVHLKAPARGDASASPVERRSETNVRLHFEEASVLLAPFFDPAMRWGKRPLNVLAMRALRERFGMLSSAELLIMLGGVRRLHESRRTPAPVVRP